jgi:hypothetical protein
MTYNKSLLENHREYPGPSENWDLIPRIVIDYLLRCGLQRNHRLIDVGCGPLRIGRHLITFLDPGCYTGLEPEWNIVEAALASELSEELHKRQQPRFLVETIGTSRLSADWALAWNVFNHVSPVVLQRALESISADNWLIDLHVADTAMVVPCDTEGWSYRFADAKATVYTQKMLDELVRGAGYSIEVIDILKSPWLPFSICWLRSGAANDCYT